MNRTMPIIAAALCVATTQLSSAATNLKKATAILLLSFASAFAWGDEPEELSILLFGHSFGIDSTEHLPALIDAAGVTSVRLARFYKANCSLEEHYGFFTNETSGSAYQYQESAPGTTTWTSSSLTFKQAIASRAWDYVVFQNSLENEGRYETAQPYLNYLVSYVRTTSQQLHGRQPEICWNLFWPISKLAERGSNSTLKYRLSFYGNSSRKMWTEYVSATRRLMHDTGITNVVQTGATIMNLRASALNTSSMKDFTRDTYHLSEGAGRYAAACAFFEHFVKPKYGVSVLGNSLRLPGLKQPVTDDNAAVLQQCAVSAESAPFPSAVRTASSRVRESGSAVGVDFCAEAKKRTSPMEFTGADGGVFRYRLAEKKPADGGKIPLVLFLHGAGERGTDNAAQLLHGVGELVCWLDAHEKGYRLVAGQVPKGKRWVEVNWGAKSHKMPKEPSETMSLLLQFLDKQLADPSVDASRVYVTGISMGGYGTWDIVCRRPDVFAAAVPICGGGDVAQAKKIAGLPIWGFHGSSDRAVPVCRTRNMMSALWSVGSNAHYREYPDAGHNVWTRTYRDAEVLGWFFRQRRPKK